MRGLRETLRIQTSSGIPWFHRRICLTVRGPNPFGQPSNQTGQYQPTQAFIDTSNGIERLFFNINNNNSPGARTLITDLLFKGAEGVDWNDYIIAPTDNTRVDIKFDKTWTLSSGNANGVVRERKLWHGMNKNLVYDDDENGETNVSSYYSVDSKEGMGDYYILDFFQGGTGATASDLLQVNANSTLYWHEK